MPVVPLLVGWLPLVLALLSFLIARANGASVSEALGAAFLVGGVAYGVENYTNWGKENMGSIDGSWEYQGVDGNGNPIYVPPGGTVEWLDDGTAIVKDAAGGTQLGSVLTPATTSALLKSLAGAAVASTIVDEPWFWAVAGLGVFLLLKRSGSNEVAYIKEQT